MRLKVIKEINGLSLNKVYTSKDTMYCTDEKPRYRLIDDNGADIFLICDYFEIVSEIEQYWIDSDFEYPF
jgi:hypothetical protein